MKKPVSYFQTDVRWKNIPYAVASESSTIGSAGCGPTAAAMLIATFKDANVTPIEACAWSKSKGYKFLNQGTAYSFFNAYGKIYGLTWTQLNSSNIQYMTTESAKTYHYQALKAIQDGHAVIAVMAPGNWAKNGHYILWYDFDGTNVYINDPAGTAAGRVKNSLKLFQSQVKYYWICKCGDPFIVNS